MSIGTSRHDSSCPGRSLFGEARLGVLLQLFGNTQRAFEVRDLARLTGCLPASVRRELTVLEREGLVTKSVQGRRTSFRVDTRARLFAPLHLLAQELGEIGRPAAAAGPRAAAAEVRPAPRSAIHLRPPRVTAALYDQHFTFISLLMNDWVLRHLSRVYHQFDGDLTAALVLGEVAHHNISALAPAVDYDRDRIRAAIMGPDGLNAMLPCNAFSISEATGIPRETVRRKVKELVARGWLVLNPKREIFISPDVARDFGSMNFATGSDLIETVDRMRARIFGDNSPR